MATLSVEIPTDAIPRVRVSVRDHLGLDHLPSNAEISAYLTSHIRDIVVKQVAARKTAAAATEAEAEVVAEFPAS